MMPLTMSIARARGGVIGFAGALPWRIPEDLRRFRAATMGHTLIVGRATAESLPPLPGRDLVVLSRDVNHPRFDTYCTIGAAINGARLEDPEPFVIGGAQVYRAALPYVTRALVTEIDRDVEGDAFFGVDFGAEGFREVSREVVGDVAFVEWRRG
jgi:dihydrofolate reductase